MAQVEKNGGKPQPTRVPRDEKKVRVAPPRAGRYARSEGAGPGPERHHNGPKRT